MPTPCSRPTPIVYPVASNSMPPSTIRLVTYRGRTVMVLGSLQVAVGVLCIIVQILALHYEVSHSHKAAGIYCGIVYIIAGALGIRAGRTQTKRSISVFLAASGIAVVMVTLLLGFSALSIDGDAEYYVWRCSDIAPDYDCQVRHSIRIFHIDRIAISSILVILAIAELGLFIWSSAVSYLWIYHITIPRNDALFGVTVQYLGGDHNSQESVLIQQPLHSTHQQLHLQNVRGEVR